jgi:hypothetical protein
VLEVVGSAGGSRARGAGARCAQRRQTRQLPDRVSLSIATRSVHVRIDFALYLPESWTSDPERRAECKIPDEVVFKTEHDLMLEMIERAATTRSQATSFSPNAPTVIPTSFVRPSACSASTTPAVSTRPRARSRTRGRHLRETVRHSGPRRPQDGRLPELMRGEGLSASRGQIQRTSLESSVQAKPLATPCPELVSSPSTCV